MNREELLANLKQLHEQLTEGGVLDPETRAMLDTVTSDIRNALDQEVLAPAGEEPLSERIRLKLIEFEARHPNLSGILERITDGLASMGI
jgi:hypothetical protein